MNFRLNSNYPPLPSTNKTSELRIKNVAETDFGVYACTAEIAGSNNRQQIAFSLKQAGAGGLRSAGGLVVGGAAIVVASGLYLLWLEMKPR